MFSDSNWLLEPPFFTVKLLRKLTGILDVPGIFAVGSKDALTRWGKLVLKCFRSGQEGGMQLQDKKDWAEA
jgi:hypothetical protein